MSWEKYCLPMAGLPSRYTSSLRINPRTFRQAIFKIITAAYLQFKVFWDVTHEGSNSPRTIWLLDPDVMGSRILRKAWNRSHRDI